MMYQIAINLYKTVNENLSIPSTELIRLLEEVVCTQQQVMFELFKSNQSKIGMNANENKLYYINKIIVLAKLKWSFSLKKNK